MGYIHSGNETGIWKPQSIIDIPAGFLKDNYIIKDFSRQVIECLLDYLPFIKSVDTISKGKNIYQVMISIISVIIHFGTPSSAQEIWIMEESLRILWL